MDSILKLLQTHLAVDIIRVIVLLSTLVYASYTDYMTRTVSNKLWYFPIVSGFIIILYEFILRDPLKVGVSVLISVSIMLTIGYTLYKTRIFYGADYRAFFVIGLLIPVQPDILQFPIYDFSQQYANANNLPFVLRYNLQNSFKEFNILLKELILHISFNVYGISVFVNSSIVTTVFFVTNVYHNIKNNNFSIKRPLRSLTARRVSTKNIDEVHSIIIDQSEKDNFIYRGINYLKNGLYGLSTGFYADYMEWYRKSNKINKNKNLDDLDEIKLEEFIDANESWHITGDDEIQSVKNRTEKYLEKDFVWVTMSTPFIISITVGSIISILFGNLAYILLLIV